MMVAVVMMMVDMAVAEVMTIVMMVMMMVEVMAMVMVHLPSFSRWLAVLSIPWLADPSLQSLLWSSYGLLLVCVCLCFLFL